MQFADSGRSKRLKDQKENTHNQFTMTLEVRESIPSQEEYIVCVSSTSENKRKKKGKNSEQKRKEHCTAYTLCSLLSSSPFSE
jgi:hypothetical protein